MNHVKSYRESHLGQGIDYHELFTANRHRAMMWNWERKVLDSATRRLLGESPAHLDFACGTGRLLGHFVDKVSRSTGVDVSPSMLAIARKITPAAEIIESDLTQGDVLGERSFDLITAFRFFPNAEADLRQDVICLLAKHVAPGGIVVFNNHLKRNSAAHLAEALIGRARKRRMEPSEVEALIASAGLEVLEIQRHGILPMTERFVPLPLSVLEWMEDFLEKISIFHSFAQNWIYVCGRAGARK